MEFAYFIPIAGRIYLNRNGERYLCLRATRYDALSDSTAVFERCTDGWTLTAHGVRRYEDRTIEWNYSTDGHWPKT